MSSIRRRSRQLAETLLIAAVGGVACEAAGLPAGLISGAVLAVAAAALAGRRMMVPAPLTRVILVVVGIALGSVVTPETLAGLAAHPLSIAVLGIASLCMMAATAVYLCYVHRWSPLSALLGASPGAFSQVVALSAESDVNVPAILVVQTIRVIILAAGLPAGLTLLGLSHPLPLESAPHGSGSVLDMTILIVTSGLAALLLDKMRFPGAWLFGAMIGSAALHGAGLTHALLPAWASGVAMVALGAVTGSRFAGTSPRVLSRYLAAGIGSFAVAVTIASGFLALAVSLLDLRLADAAIAYAPGAQDTMMLLALALRLDPVFVGAHHLARFLIVSLAVPTLASIILRHTGGASTQ